MDGMRVAPPHPDMPRRDRFALRAASYAIGTLAAFWFFERLGGFVS